MYSHLKKGKTPSRWRVLRRRVCIVYDYQWAFSMVYKIVTAFSPWIMSNNLLTDVARIREEILPRFKTMWCWIIRWRNSSIGSRKSRHRAAYKTTYPSTPDTAAPGAGAARIRRIEPEIEAGEERYKLSFPGYIQILLTLPMIIARRCRTKTQQQWQVNL